MTTKITIDVRTPEALAWLKTLITAAAMMLGDAVDVKYTTVTNKDKAQVRYKAIVGKDILEAIGESTVKGRLLKRIIEDYPNTTAKALEEATHFTVKSVESGVNKLLTMDKFIISEPITEASVPVQDIRRGR